MKFFRTLSTARLIALAVIVLAVAVGGAFAVAATGGSGPTPPSKPLAQAIHDALGGAKPDGITARIGFTNTLFPSGSIVGQAGSALISSATGRLWVNANGGRLELQSDAGDAQIVWSEKKVTVYDASSNTAYVADLPRNAQDHGKDAGKTAVPSIDEITKFLTDLGKEWTVSGADPTNTGGQESYTVKVSPSHDGGLLGSAELAFDALRGVPLKVAIYAQGASSPVLALEATNVSYGAVPDSDVQVAPPAGAKIVDLSSQAQAGGGHEKGNSTPPVTGAAAIAQAPFAAVVPDTLVGLPRQDVRLVGGKSVISVYGQGLGAVVVLERAKDATAAKQASPLDQLPAVTIDGATGHELATQLGTVLTWDRAGVSYVLAGSLPSAAAEAAARSLE